MRVLVTGSSGFIGGNLLQRLIAQGVEAWGASRNPKNSLRELKCDFSNLHQSERLFTEHSFDSVVHCASSILDERTSWNSQAYFNNVSSTLNLALLASLKSVRRFVFLSSNAVYGTSYEIRSGQELPQPNNWYSQSKAVSEKILFDFQSRMGITILRLPAITGPGLSSPNLVGDMVESLKKKGTIEVYGSGTARRQVLDVRDLCQVIKIILEKNLDLRYVILPVISDEVLTVAEMAKKTVQTSGKGRVEFNREKQGSLDQWVNPAIFSERFDYRFKWNFERSVKEIIQENKND